VFNLSGSELIVLLLVALIILGPERLPEAVRSFGRVYGQIRRMGEGFQAEMRSVLDEPIREVRDTAELARRTMSGDDPTSTPPQSSSPNPPPTPPASPPRGAAESPGLGGDEAAENTGSGGAAASDITPPATSPLRRFEPSNESSAPPGEDPAPEPEVPAPSDTATLTDTASDDPGERAP
jgi:sec-independent protein translocase protein TatB